MKKGSFKSEVIKLYELPERNGEMNKILKWKQVNHYYDLRCIYKWIPCVGIFVCRMEVLYWKCNCSRTCTQGVLLKLWEYAVAFIHCDHSG